ncbi:hypothetical protein NYE69_19435 [Paenibacillus sp. FSL R5-0527]|uniref:hypothetical protein n=1 Tax=Paenibacillus sp. FSL R5-0527 TaxID=2975321 RepID=UPI00097AB175|nr:hypothetical protein BK140_01285 [Paenibacillus macerans]
MPEEAMKAHYFVDEAGRTLPFVQNLNDCYERAVYFSVANSVADIDSYQSIFIGDLSFCLQLESNNRNLKLSTYKNLFAGAITLDRAFFIKNNATEALAGIEEWLNRKDYLLLRTAENKLPFLRRFAPEAINDESYNPGHLLLLLWHDESNLYFVENPLNLCPERFTAFYANPEVGIISKKEMIEALGHFSEVFTVRIHPHLLNKVGKSPLNVLSHYTEHYETVTFEDGVQFYYNRQALRKLVQLCKEESLYLNLDYSRPDENKLLVGLDRIIRRRRLFYDYICDKNHDSKFTSLLESNIQGYEMARYDILSGILRGNWLLHKEYAPHFEYILTTEDEIYGTREAEAWLMSFSG